MHPIIQPSSAIRTNYNEIAQVCRTQNAPVFLTKNGKGDTVLMDIDTYSQREDDLLVAQRLIDAQRARMAGAPGYTVDEFETGMRDAIVRGSQALDL
jgi:PHD/YefM family antitoxin component YafN of YafNO toxin-antitoxin module